MGAIRGILLVFVIVLFFLSIISVNIFWTLSSSLEYNNLQKESTIIIKDFLQKDINISNHVQEIYPVIQSYCQNNSNYVFNFEGNTFDIDCSVAAQGTDALIDASLENIIHNTYYANYDCNFLDCFNEIDLEPEGVTPLFLISEKAYSYWADNLYISLLLAFIFLILIFFLIEKKTSMPILVGILLIISALPFIKLLSLLSIFSDKMLFKLLSIFFSQSYAVSVKIIIIGVVLLAAGIVLKIFKVGFSISHLISKFKNKKEDKEKPKEEKKETKVEGKKIKKKPKYK